MNKNNRFQLTATAALVLLADPVKAQEISESPPAASGSSQNLPSLWDLAVQGGWFMIPIAVASVITVMFTLERLHGLRRARILPKRVLKPLRELLATGAVEPRKLWQCSLKSRSPLAQILRAAVLKTGRPQNELEASVVDAVNRETMDMTRNLRPINVVASIAPLIGLLGTVQGMIMAFMVTSTTSSTGTAKAQELAHGIYTALVTTFAGLCVAVVSVVLANFLEGKIQRRLKELEQLFLILLPRLETWEGRIRVHQSTDAADQIRVLKTARSPDTAVHETRAVGGKSVRPPGAARRMLTTKTAAASNRSAAGNAPRTENVAGNGVKPAAAEPVAAQAATAAGPQTLRSNFER